MTYSAQEKTILIVIKYQNAISRISFSFEHTIWINDSIENNLKKEPIEQEFDRESETIRLMFPFTSRSHR